MDLQAALPHLLPDAISWAESIAHDIAISGTPLDHQGLTLAREVGVKQPEQIRLRLVETLPLPDNSPRA